MSTREETIERLREQAAAEVEPEPEPELPLEEDEPKRSTIREYVVFILIGDNTWREEARVNAGSAGSAISTLGEKLNIDAQYAACPSRNWSVGSPDVKTTTSIKIKFQ